MKAKVDLSLTGSVRSSLTRILPLALLLLALASATRAQAGSPKAYAEKTIDLLRVPMLNCPERVWPEYSWKDTDRAILFVDSNFKFAAFWDVKTDELRSLNFAELPPQASSYFSFLELEGRKTVSVNLAHFGGATAKAAWDHALDLVAHEAFHYFGQTLSPSWQTVESQHGRGDFYPILAEPRYQRASTLASLEVQTMVGRSDSSRIDLSPAASWYTLWRKGSPEEYGNFTDRTEGSAQYVEARTVALAIEGCKGSEEALSRSIARKYEYSLEPSLDSESYELGMRSGMLMDLLGRSDWKERVNQGEAPADILFENSKTTKVEMNEGLKSQVEESLAKTHQGNENILGPLYQDLVSGEFVLVSIPATWEFGGSFTSKGFYIFRDLPESQVTLFGDTYEISKNDSDDRIELKTDSAVVRLGGGCGNQWSYMFIPKSELPTDLEPGQRIEYNSESYLIDAIVEQVTEVEGLRAICLR